MSRLINMCAKTLTHTTHVLPSTDSHLPMHKSCFSIADSLLTAELLHCKIDLLEAGRAVTALDAWRFASAFSIQVRRRYTLTRVSRAWGMSRTTLYRKRRRETARRRTPPAPPTDSQIVAHLRDWITRTPFPAERHRKLWARLQHLGIQVSRERVRRLVRQHQLVPQPGRGVLTDQPDVMWGIDSAKVRTDWDAAVCVLFAVDHCTAECLAIDAVPEETISAWHSVIHAARRYAMTDAGKPALMRGIILRHDNLKLFRSRNFQAPLRKLAMRCSAISPLRPQGNGCAERFIRTLRENLISIRSFPDLSSLSTALRDFQRIYNHDWLLTRWQYASPSAVRSRFRGGTLSGDSPGRHATH